MTLAGEELHRKISCRENSEGRKLILPSEEYVSEKGGYYVKPKA
jgi:hypothetical protein